MQQNNKKLIILTVFLLLHMFNITYINAQNQNQTIAREAYIKDSIKICTPKKIYPQLGLDNRKSFIRNSPVDIEGAYIGILYKSRYKFSVGYYQVDNEGHANKRIKDKQIITIRDLELYYTTFNFEYLAINRRYIKLGLPVDLGYGFSNISIYDENKSKLLYHSVGKFTPFSIGTELTIKPVRWVGITGLIGYRKILRRSEPRLDFDGVFYSYGISIDVKEIVKDIRLMLAKKRYKKSLNLK